jgi:hypothetical protein
MVTVGWFALGLALWVLVSVLSVGSGFWYGLMLSYLVDLFYLSCADFFLLLWLCPILVCCLDLLFPELSLGTLVPVVLVR